MEQPDEIQYDMKGITFWQDPWRENKDLRQFGQKRYESERVMTVKQTDKDRWGKRTIKFENFEYYIDCRTNKKIFSILLVDNWTFRETPSEYQIGSILRTRRPRKNE